MLASLASIGPYSYQDIHVKKASLFHVRMYTHFLTVVSVYP